MPRKITIPPNPCLREIELPSMFVYFNRLNTPHEFFDALMTRKLQDHEPQAPLLLITPDLEEVTDFESYYGKDSQHADFLDCPPVAKVVAEQEGWHLFDKGEVRDHVCRRFMGKEFFDVLRQIIDRKAVGFEAYDESRQHPIDWGAHEAQLKELSEAAFELSDLFWAEWSWSTNSEGHDSIKLGFRLNSIKPAYRRDRSLDGEGFNDIVLDMGIGGLWRNAILGIDYYADKNGSRLKGLKKEHELLIERIKARGITADIKVRDYSHEGDRLWTKFNISYDITTPHRQTVKNIVMATLDARLESYDLNR